MKRALVAFALTAGLLGSCAGGPEPSGDVRMGAAPPGDVLKLEAGDNVFSPTTLTGKSGEKLTVEVTNQGKVPHDFTIKELGLSTGVLQPRSIATATFTLPDEDLDYVCTLHRGMDGKIDVSTE